MITFILFVLVVLILFPFSQRILFQRRFTTRYTPSSGSSSNIVHSCVYCGESIHQGQKIVTRCDHKIHLSCWRENDNQCPEYPSKCQTGFQKKLKMDWYAGSESLTLLPRMIQGILGGFFAFFLGHVLALYFESMTEPAALKALLIRGAIEHAAFGVTMGFAFGFCFFVLVPTVWKRGEVLKMLLRTVGLALITGLLYFLLFLVKGPIPARFSLLTDLLFWGVVGFLFGGMLVKGTGSRLKNGLIGGLIAGIIGWFVKRLLLPETLYALDIPQKFPGVDFSTFSSAEGLVVFGLCLGGIFTAAIAVLEKFYLDYRHPNGKRGRVPIHKWMTQGKDVVIGRDPNNHVPTHWDEEIMEKHAALVFNQEKNRLSLELLVRTEPAYFNHSVISPKEEIYIKDRDEFRLGDTTFQLVIPSEYILEYSHHSGKKGSVPIHKWMGREIEVSVGAAAKNHVQVNWDSSILEEHAVLYLDGETGKIRLRAASERAVIYINDQLLTVGNEAILAEGVEFVLGETKMACKKN